MFKLYLTERTLNEATTYYIGLIRQAVEKAGHQFQYVRCTSEIRKGDIVITAEAKDYVKVKLHKPFNRQIVWFQGVVPEEAMMALNSKWRKLMWEVFEKAALSASVLNLFVSEAMRQHYSEKYGYRSKRHIIIPCYNKHLNEEAFFSPDKYSRPSFVYSGSLARWQCIDEMLSIYRLVEDQLPEASLTLLTGEQEQALAKVRQYELKRVQVRHCPLEALDRELATHKYGFIIREDHIVNNVATPTKMNTYLAMGVVPVYTNVMHAFRDHPAFNAPMVKLRPGLSVQQAAEEIIRWERSQQVLPGQILQAYQQLFREYYDDGHYINALVRCLNEFVL